MTPVAALLHAIAPNPTACLACVPKRPSRHRNGMGGTPGWLTLLQRLLHCQQVEHQPGMGAAPLPAARVHGGAAPAAPTGARLDDSCRWGSTCRIRQLSAKPFLLLSFLFLLPLLPAAPVAAVSNPPALAAPLGPAAAPATATGPAAAGAAAAGLRGAVPAATLPGGPTWTAVSSAATARPGQQQPLKLFVDQAYR